MEAKSLIYNKLRLAQSTSWNRKRRNIELAATSWPYLVVQRKWDETPTKLSFGKFANVLMTWALERLQRKSNLSPQLREKLAKEIRLKGQGVIKILACKLQAWWGDTEADSFECVLPPTAIQRGTAVNMESAIDQSFPELSNAQLVSLASMVQWLGIFLVRDGFPANTLMVKRLVAILAQQTCGNALVLDVLCCVHVVFGCLKYILAFGENISPLYCIGNLLHIADYHTRLVHGIFDLLVQELDYRVVASWDNRYQGLCDALLERTLFKNITLKRQRASIFVEGVESKHCKVDNDATLQKQGEECRRLFNGNIMTPVVAHFCLGSSCCPDGRLGCCLAMLQLLVDMLLRKLPPVLAISKWTSMQANVKWWDLACSLHNIVPRGWCKVWPVNSPEMRAGHQPGAEDSDDWHTVCCARLLKSSKWCAKAVTWFTLRAINIITACIDYFIWLVVAADSCSAEELTKPLIVHLVHPEGPAHGILIDLEKLLKKGSSLMKFLEVAGQSQPEADQVAWWQEFGSLALILVLAEAARVFFKLIPLFDTYIVKLFGILDNSYTDVEKEAFCQRFWNKPDCCKGRCGKQFFRQLRSKGWKALLSNPFLSFWQKMAEVMGVAIADVESKHREATCISRKFHQKKPHSIERFLYDTFLEVWRDFYTKQGGRDPRFISKQTMKMFGMFQRKLRRRVAHGGNPVFFYISQQTKGMHGSRRKMTVVRKKLKAKYDAMPEEAKALWYQRWKRAQEDAAEEGRALSY